MAKAPPDLGPCIPKHEQVYKLAREAGHSLTGSFKCDRCQMQVPMRKCMAYLEALLHQKCPDSVSKHFSGIDLITLVSDYEQPENDVYLAGQVRVHSSHALAVHYGLKLKFCTCCGAHGKNRSNYLAKPCKRKATRAGRGALRLIRRGKLPGTYLQSHLDRRGLRVRLGNCKFSPRGSRQKRDGIRGSVIPTSLKRVHRKHLDNPGANSLGWPNASPKSGPAETLNSASRFSNKLSSSFANGSPHQDYLEGAFAPPWVPGAAVPQGLPSPRPPLLARVEQRDGTGIILAKAALARRLKLTSVSRICLFPFFVPQVLRLWLV